MLDPYNLAAIDDVRFITGFTQITVASCVEADFKRYIQDHLDTNGLIDEIMDGEGFFKMALRYVGGPAPGEQLDELLRPRGSVRDSQDRQRDSTLDPAARHAG